MTSDKQLCKKPVIFLLKLIVSQVTGFQFKPCDSILGSILFCLGANVTNEYNHLYERLESAIHEAVKTAQRKEEKNEPDINFRAALALADWRPTHPLEKAAEYFDFDFEFGDEPEDTSAKSNAKVILQNIYV